MTDRDTYISAPAPELTRLLEPLYDPCPGFQGACRTVMRWNPGAGHVPGGFRGAIGQVSEVELILVCAEPGDPFPEEKWQHRDRRSLLASVYGASQSFIRSPTGQFERNIRTILDLAWPGATFEEQMCKTWITESVLCSAPQEGASIPRNVEYECTRRYFLAQVRLLPKARIVALGQKAQRRLSRLGIAFHAAWAASPPGCNRPEALASWRKAVAGLSRSRQ